MAIGTRTEYFVVQGTSPEEFIATVNQYLSEDWVLYEGPVAVDTDLGVLWAQAVIREIVL